MLPKLHAAFTGLLLVVAVSFAALWYKGRATPFAAPAGREEKPAQADAAGRYSIEPDEGARFLLDGAGPQGFFGANVLEAWVFKYTGGYLQVSLETDIDGAARSGDVLPGDWPALLSRDDGVRQDKAAAFRKQGYVVLTAMPSVVTVDDALHQYRVQLGGAFAAGHLGPLYTLAPLLQEVTHLRPYRLFLAASPPPKMTGAGFNLWAEHVLPIREPIIPRRLADEEYHVGGGKNLQAGKDFTLLDRSRGHSRVRLKARFLGDGEVRELAGKASAGEPGTK
jgi:hypothetical protein